MEGNIKNMQRISIKCAHCEGNDFEVMITECPRGMDIVCKGCGHMTPLMFYTKEIGSARFCIHGINNRKSAELYQESHYRDISESEVEAC